LEYKQIAVFCQANIFPRDKGPIDFLEIALAVGELGAAEASFSAGEPEPKMRFNLGGGRIMVFANCLPYCDGLARVKRARGDLAGAIEIYRKLNTPGVPDVMGADSES
jgi:hypothetical protein